MINNPIVDGISLKRILLPFIVEAHGYKKLLLIFYFLKIQFQLWIGPDFQENDHLFSTLADLGDKLLPINEVSLHKTADIEGF